MTSFSISLSNLQELYDSYLLDGTKRLVENSPNYPGFRDGDIEALIRCFHWGIHYQCLCAIADEEKEGQLDRYIIFEGLTREAINQYKAIYDLRTLSTPDLYDSTQKVFYDLKTVLSESEDVESLAAVRRASLEDPIKLLMFTYWGHRDFGTSLSLNETQLDRVSNILNTIRNELMDRQLWTMYVTVMRAEPKVVLYKPSSMWDTTEEVVDISGFKNELENYYSRSAIKWHPVMKLPLIPDLFQFDRTEYMEYKSLLLGIDSYSFTSNESLNNHRAIETIKKYFNENSITLLIDREGVSQSLLDLSLNILFDRPVVQDTVYLIGTGYKAIKEGRRKHTDSLEYTSKRTAPTPKMYHKWIEEELSGLKESSLKELNVLKVASPMTETDELGKKCYDEVMNVLKDSKGYELLLKVEATASRIYSFAYNNRDEYVVIPIRLTSVEGLSYIYGFVIKGHTHMKSDTDRIPLLVCEFYDGTTEDFDIKYPKHSLFQMGSHYLTIRQNSLWNLKCFYLSTIKRTLIPVINCVNRTWFRKCAEIKEFVELDLTLPVWVERHEITLSEWAIRVFCLHLNMALCNDSQVEAYCADIRRLQMFTRALMKGGSLFLAEGANPEEKVAESVINNPITLYMAECWNKHVEIFNGDLKSRQKQNKRASSAMSRSSLGSSSGASSHTSD